MWWIHKIIKQIQIYGVYYHLVKELKLDSERFQQYFRMTIKPLLAKVNRGRETINAKATFCNRAYVSGGCP